MSESKISYRFFDRCNNTPALPYIYYVNHELHELGYGVDTLNFSYESKSFVAFNGDTPVGIILFEGYRWRNTLLVLTGFVNKEYRAQGIYTELWRRVVEHAQEEKFPIIEGGTHVTNAIMQEVMKSQGRVATHITYTFKVPEKK